MINRRGNSDSNLHRFAQNEDDDSDKKLSSFLPGFLVKKIEKDDLKYKQNLFPGEEDEEDALEIKMDNYYINEKEPNVRQ